MNETEFAIEYGRKHLEMSISDAAVNAHIAWVRRINQPTGDLYAYWMQDTMMELETARAMRAVSVKVEYGK